LKEETAIAELEYQKVRLFRRYWRIIRFYKIYTNVFILSVESQQGNEDTKRQTYENAISWFAWITRAMSKLFCVD